MRVLHVNCSDISGGAARAAYRIHRGLRGINVNSKMIVQTRFGDDKTVIDAGSRLSKFMGRVRPFSEFALLKLLSGGATSLFSCSFLPFSAIPALIKKNETDIVHLHWVCNGTLRIEDIGKINRPVVWTVHDMWAFTGGCHYSGECDRYLHGCGRCPQLMRSGPNDLSRSVLRRKERGWSGLDLTIVAPSSWIAGCARRSKLFADRRVEVIPNGVDITVYKPLDRKFARDAWNLPNNRKLVLFGALHATSDMRKGFDLLSEAIRLMADQWHDGIELVVFGASEPECPQDFGIPVNFIGHLSDDISLAMLYSAVDVMVVPSRQDNLPNTVVESLACGTPVVAFDIGGMPDLIEHKVTGYLARPFDVADLAEGVGWMLTDDHRLGVLGVNARAKALKCFDMKEVAARYAGLYQDVAHDASH